MGPKSCANEGRGSVMVQPSTMMVGMNPQCSAFFAYGAACCQMLSTVSMARYTLSCKADDIRAEIVFGLVFQTNSVRNAKTFLYSHAKKPFTS
jgi:hypothetical protein